MKVVEKLNCLLFKEIECYVLQCLQYDIVSQGETIDHCLSEFKRLLLGYCYLRTLFPPLNLSKAPYLYWKRYDENHAFNKMSYIIETDLIIYEIDVKIR